MTLPEIIQMLRSMAESLEIDVPSDAGYVEEIRAIIAVLEPRGQIVGQFVEARLPGKDEMITGIVIAAHQDGKVTLFNRLGEMRLCSDPIRVLGDSKLVLDAHPWAKEVRKALNLS